MFNQLIMKHQRLLLHICFWVLYFSITLFNDIFLTSDLASRFETELALRTFLSGLILLSVKIGFTYSVLFYFLPTWLRSAHRKRESLYFIFVLIAFVIMVRMIIQFFTWPCILHYTPHMSTQSQVARFLYSLLDVLQLVGITVSIKLLRLRVANSLLERDYLKEKMSSDLSRLKAQIHPHFLFNMLNNIYSLSKNNSQKTSEIIHKMSLLLRYMLYESEKKLVTLESEVQIIKDYSGIQQFRFGDGIRVDQTIEMDNSQTPITPLVLFPLIENAFKHGIGTRTDDSYIVMDLRLKKEKLELSIRNSIVEHSVKSPSDGIGQLNIKKQLALLYRDYTFEYEQKENEYRVYLYINLNSFIDFELLNY